jgi:hypothetical protein
MMTKMVNRGLLAAFAASALALIGAFLIAGSASANPASVTLSAGAITDNTVKVDVTITPASGETVAGVIAHVTYDESKLTATACTPSATCNLDFATGDVAVGMGPNLSGLSGVSGSVTFTLASGFTTGSTPVGITIEECSNELGEDITSTCTGTGTSIAIATPTPTPSPTPVVTASPTATPAGLPQTGGPTGESSSMLTWLLVAAGLVIVSGGAWAVSRARREI